MLENSARIKRLARSERTLRRDTLPRGAIRLDRGEPDFPTPLHIQEAATPPRRKTSKWAWIGSRRLWRS
jgi:aspartate/methionine/tyrosine aminotransferase